MSRARTAALPQASPDGRFELRVDEFEDRGFVEFNTYLVDRAAGRDLAWLGNGIDAGFLPDGLLRVQAAWNGGDVTIDPARESFRTRDDMPWLPLAAWGLAESAYLRGWGNGLDFRSSDPAWAFPWVEGCIAIASIVLVALLAWKPWLDLVPRATFLIIGSLVAVGFVYLTALNLRSWRLLRSLRSSRR